MRYVSSIAILVSIAVLLCMVAVWMAVHLGIVPSIEFGRPASVGMILVVVTFGVNFLVLSASKVGLRLLASTSTIQLGIALNVLLLLLSLMAARTMRFDGRDDLLLFTFVAMIASATCALGLVGELLRLTHED